MYRENRAMIDNPLEEDFSPPSCLERLAFTANLALGLINGIEHNARGTLILRSIKDPVHLKVALYLYREQFTSQNIGDGVQSALVTNNYECMRVFLQAEMITPKKEFNVTSFYVGRPDLSNLAFMSPLSFAIERNWHEMSELFICANTVNLYHFDRMGDSLIDKAMRVAAECGDFYLLRLFLNDKFGVFDIKSQIDCYMVNRDKHSHIFTSENRLYLSSRPAEWKEKCLRRLQITDNPNNIPSVAREHEHRLTINPMGIDIFG